MQHSLRAIHQASVIAFMRKADTQMGSRTLEWYEKKYRKVFPRNRDPSADVGEQDEGKPVCPCLVEFSRQHINPFLRYIGANSIRELQCISVIQPSARTS